MRRLLAVPDWQQLSAPLFRASQTVLLAKCGERTAAAGGTGVKKEKDESEGMTQVLGPEHACVGGCGAQQLAALAFSCLAAAGEAAQNAQ